MNIDLGIISVALAIATFLIGRFVSVKQSGRDDGEMKSDVKYIKNSIEKQDAKLDGIVANYEDVKLEIERLKGRIKNLEQKVDFLHGEGGQV
jgi:peptidoglycan hydrolase CwlO-like protein